ncbi:hypothetical protein O6H91_15G084400 [Diphasiastrum complanatum]|uniref:Uncharacterized protein n=2 Tax=Diphasiastrum complanatum TaxID=34168 RepID=A0ACC2BKA6_DIPCM|nr:hypothetical protein O6H91_15G084400 [Diphasiastrum complanatum]
MAESPQKYRLCDRMRLWEFKEQFVFEPLDGEPHELLSVSRADGDIRTIGDLPVSDGDQHPKTTPIFGIVGVLRLLAGTYVLVVTGRMSVGTYHGHPVYRASSMKFFSCNSTSKALNPKERRDEAYFTRLLRTVETTPGLYFSYGVDLTLSAQRMQKLDNSQITLPLWKQADARFLWNYYMLGELIERKLDSYLLPVFQGSFQKIQVLLREKLVSVTLVSRRCMRRVGTRMWRRGADLEGSVANFVETEQILEVDGYLASYVQVRGSIPVIWEQIVDLTYKPKMRAIDLEETPKVVQRHFQDLSQRYGSVLALDLINQQGSEAVLSLAYGSAMQSLVNKNLRYVPFDFHRTCGHTHFERLTSLYDQIAEDFSDQGYFFVNPSGVVVEEQKGVARTNCIDCLDRTNVTQSLLGRKSLEVQLQRAGLFGPSDSVTQHATFDEQFKQLWADHGDNISIQYSGTSALKGDFVRHGKRTTFGPIQDGYNSLARYYLNNFHDGLKQDAMDLVTGKYDLKLSNTNLIHPKGFESYSSLPLALILAGAGVTFTSVSLRQGGQDAIQILCTILGASLTAAVLFIVRSTGREFCNKPRLCKLY